MPDETKPPVTSPGETKPAGDTPPAAAPNPELVELNKKIEGLTTWTNNLNQDNTAIKRQLEKLELEKSQLESQLTSVSRQPSALDQTKQRLAKAIEDQDFGGYAQAMGELSGQIYGLQTEHLVKVQINQGFQLASRDPDMTPEAREILAKKLYIDGDPKRGIRPLRIQEIASGGSLEEYADEAKREARGLRVDSGEYEVTVGDKKVKLKEVLQTYTATEEEKKKQIQAQTPITGGGRNTVDGIAGGQGEATGEKSSRFHSFGRPRPHIKE